MQASYGYLEAFCERKMQKLTCKVLGSKKKKKMVAWSPVATDIIWMTLVFPIRFEVLAVSLSSFLHK
jgi:hypothetical protein